ncbi:hypothetical protein V1669_00005, partial [Aeromonas enteropelogenes]|uniref:hypothetical protein n=1 Tax=Aeromonas enteropelogenes TaxID=29489 RepID=UPI0031369798
PVGDGVKRRAHNADLERMVVIRSPSSQLVPFKLYRFEQQRHCSGLIIPDTILGGTVATIT